MFFSSLLIMLIFSSGIILFAGLFTSREAEGLLVSPAPPDQIFAFKFQEAMFFSSWGFLLLGTPMMLAYGATVAAPFHFYLFAAGFFLAFSLTPGAVGALLCLLIARYFPRRRWQILLGLGGSALAIAAYLGWQAWARAQGLEISRSWLNGLMQQFRLVDLPFVPSRWISRGLLAAGFRDAEGPAAAGYYLLMLASNGLAIYLLAAYLYRCLYRAAYDRMHTEGQPRRIRRSARVLPAVVERMFAPLQGPIRVLILKDVRTFIRDPLQWSQVLIFVGLLLFYLITLGRMNYYTASPYWRNLIGFFNLAVTGLILSTFTSRFIFPLLSLEGRKFWILGLSPVSRSAILWGKFAFAAGGSLLATVFLTLVGSVMLRLEPFLVVLQMLTVIVLCLGLSGISVGLGARFPDMRESDPSRIAAGFGGTLNLVASLLFLSIVVVTMALPCHLYSITLAMEAGTAGIDLNERSAAGISFSQFRWMLAGSVSLCLLMGAGAVWLPMRLGIKAFERMEF